jgi:two-component system chemotaxis response regulator CheB
MASLLDRIARSPTEKAVPVPADLRAEVRIAEGVYPDKAMSYSNDTPAGISCPECGGSLWQIEDEGVTRYRCRVGHGYTSEVLLASQNGNVSDSLWAAVRTMQERVELLKRLADDSESRGAQRSAETYRQRADESAVHAETIRQLLVAGHGTEPLRIAE